MTIKCTGAEFKAFYSDPKFWPDEQWHEGEQVTINGVDREGWDVSYDQLDDADQLTITGGCVMDANNGDREVGTLEGHFRKWRREQTSTVVLVRVPNDKLAAFDAACKAAGVTKIK